MCPPPDVIEFCVLHFSEGESNVGELLKAKAAEGVKVLMMIWDEKLSTQASPGKTQIIFFHISKTV